MKNQLDFSPSGRVTCELIDADGNIKETTTSNLVVDTGHDVLARSLSGVDFKPLFKRPVLMEDPIIDPIGADNDNPNGLEEDVNFYYELSYKPTVIIETINNGNHNYQQVEGTDLDNLWENVSAVTEGHLDSYIINKKSKIYTTFGINFTAMGESGVYDIQQSHDLYSFSSDWTLNDTNKYMETAASGETIEFEVKANKMAFVFQTASGISSDISVQIDGVNITDSSISKNIKIIDYTNYDVDGFKEMSDVDMFDSIDSNDITEFDTINTDVDTNSAVSSSGDVEFVLDMSGMSEDLHTITLTNNTTSTASFYQVLLEGVHQGTQALSDEVGKSIHDVDTPEIYNSDEETSQFTIDAKGKRIHPIGNNGNPDIEVYEGDTKFNYIAESSNLTEGANEFTLLSNNDDGYYIDYDNSIINFFTSTDIDTGITVEYEYLDNNGNKQTYTDTESDFGLTLPATVDELELTQDIINDSDLLTFTITNIDGEEIEITNEDPVIELSETHLNVNVTYSLEVDFDTEYKRSAIDKPKPGSDDYPNYNYRYDKIIFNSEFDKNNPIHPVNVHQLALCSKSDYLESEEFIDNIFAITNVGGITKRPDDILKVKWEIDLN